MQTAPFRIDAGRHGIHLRAGNATDPLGGPLQAVVFDKGTARLLAQAPAMRAALQALLDLHQAHHNHPAHAAARAILREAQ